MVMKNKFKFTVPQPQYNNDGNNKIILDNCILPIKFFCHSQSVKVNNLIFDTCQAYHPTDLPRTCMRCWLSLGKKDMTQTKSYYILVRDCQSCRTGLYCSFYCTYTYGNLEKYPHAKFIIFSLPGLHVNSNMNRFFCCNPIKEESMIFQCGFLRLNNMRSRKKVLYIFIICYWLVYSSKKKI